MFKKLKEKITEEVKSSPQRFQQLTQSVSDKLQNSTISDENFFSIGDDDANTSSTSIEPGFSNVSLTSPQENRFRRNSNSSFASDVSFLPRYESTNMYHLQSDLDVSASEIEDNASTASSQLGHLTKEQIYSAFQKSQLRYHKYRGRYTDLAKHYKDLERENGKMKSVLVETQDKAIRRITELKEQCTLEQKAKAHLESALRDDIDEKQLQINALQQKIQLIQNGNSSEPVNTENLDNLTKYLNDARLEIEQLNTRLQEMKANSIIFQSKEQEYKTKISQLEKELVLYSEREKENNLSLAQHKMELHNEILNKDAELSNLKQDCEVLRQSLEAFETKSTNNTKLDNLQSQNKNLIDKLEKLNAKCNQQENELLKMEQLKQENANITSLSEKLKKRLENVENELTNAPKEDFDAKCKELEEKLREMQQIREENSNLTSLSENLKKQLENVKNELESVQNEQKASLLNLESKCKEQEKELIEIQRLRDENANITSLSEQLKNQLKSVENELDKVRNDAKTSLLNLEEKISQKYSKDFDLKVKNLRDEYELKIKDISNNSSTAEIDLIERENTIKSLKDELIAIKQDFDGFKTKYTDLEQNHLELIEEGNGLRVKIAQLEKDMIENDKNKVENEKRIEDLMIELEKMRKNDKNNLFEQKLKENEAIFNEEKCKFENKIVELTKIIDNLKIKEENSLKTYEIDKVALENQVKSLETEKISLLEQVDLLKKDINKLQIDYQQILAENSSFLEQINTKSDLETELTRLKQIEKDFLEINSVKNAQEDQITILNTKIDEYKANLVKKTEKIDEIQSKLHETNEEYETVKLELENLRAKFKSKYDEIDEIQSENERKLLEMKNITEKEVEEKFNNELIKICDENKKIVEKLESEVRKLRNEELVEKNQEFNELRVKYEKINVEFKEKLEIKEKELEKLRFDLETKNEEIVKVEENSKKQVEQTEFSLKEEIKRLTNEFEQKTAEITVETESKINELKKQHDFEVRNEITAEIQVYETQIEEIIKKYDEKTKNIVGFLNGMDINVNHPKNNRNLEKISDKIEYLNEMLDFGGKTLWKIIEDLILNSGNNLKEKIREIKLLETKLEEIQIEKEQLISIINDLQTRIETLINEKNGLEYDKNRLKDLELEMERLKQELDIINNEKNRIQDNFNEIESRNLQILNDNQFLINENTNLLQEVEELRLKTEQNSDLNQLKQQLKESEYHSDELNKEIQLLKDEIIELKTTPVNLPKLQKNNITKKLDNLEIVRMAENEKQLREIEILRDKLQQYKSLDLTNKTSIEFYENELEKLKNQNEKLNRKLDETLVTLNHCTELSNSTEIEYLKNVLYNYMLGKESVVLARVIAAVCKFDKQQTETVLAKEQQKQTLLGQLGIL